MDSISIEDIIRELDGSLPAYAWPGGYPVVYLDKSNETLCAKCATQIDKDHAEGYRDCPGVDCGLMYYEGAPIFCVECNTKIESAYGDPEEAD